MPNVPPSQTSGPNDPFDFIKIKSVRDLSSKPPPEIWSGVICLGDRVQISGASKSYKSFFTKQLCYCINYGIDFIGRKIENTIPMVDVDMELREYFLRQRVTSIARFLNGGGIDKYDTFCLRGKTKKFTPEAILKFGEVIDSKGKKGFSIDPIYTLQRDGNENLTSGVTVLTDPFDEIVESYDLLFLWTNHHSKGEQVQKAAINRAAGSGGWGRFCDISIDLLRHKEDQCFIVEITQRNFAMVPKFVIEFNLTGLCFVRRDDLSPNDYAEEKKEPSRVETSKEIVLVLIKAFQAQGTGISQKELEDISDIPVTTLNKTVRILIADEKIIRSNGVYYIK